MNGAYYAYNDWVRTTRDPRASYTDKLQAFNHYTESLNMIQREGLLRKRDWNRQSSWLELKDRITTILQGWIDRIKSWFRAGRTPSETELDQFEREVADEMERAFESLADDVYRDGMEDAAEEISGFAPEFGGRHERAIRTIRERSTVPETFRSLSEEAGNVLVDELEEAFASGEQSIDRVVNAVTQRMGEEVFPAAETVARSEAWKIWQQSKYETYREAEERRGEEFDFEFVRDLGPTPRGNPQCSVCDEIIRRTKGGVPWSELVDIIVEVSTDPEYGGSSKWDPLRDSDVPLPHPNCVVYPKTVVWTQEGKKPISRVEVGDEVLTHKGRYRRVTETHRNKAKKAVRLTIKDGSRSQRVTVTPEHPILTNHGWKAAGNLSPDDKVAAVARPCDFCGAPVLGAKVDHCSSSCRMKTVHKDEEETRRRLESAWETTRERVVNGEHHLFDPEIKKRSAKSLGEKNHGGTWIEKKVGWLLRELGYEPVAQHPVEQGREDAYGKGRYYFADWYVPELDLIIECDGEYWHTEDEERRDKVLEEKFEHVVHFSGEQIRERLDECAKRIEEISDV